MERSLIKYSFRQSDGFTLIEVLIALLILAIISMAVMKAMRDTINNTKHIQKEIIGRWVAMNVLAQMQVGRQPLPEKDGDTMSGKMTLLGQSWLWKAGVLVADQHQYYERVYINVADNSQTVFHLEGFVAKVSVYE